MLQQINWQAHDQNNQRVSRQTASFPLFPVFMLSCKRYSFIFTTHSSNTHQQRQHVAQWMLNDAFHINAGLKWSTSLRRMNETLWSSTCFLFFLLSLLSDCSIEPQRERAPIFTPQSQKKQNAVQRRGGGVGGALRTERPLKACCL